MCASNPTPGEMETYSAPSCRVTMLSCIKYQRCTYNWHPDEETTFVCESKMRADLYLSGNGSWSHVPVLRWILTLIWRTNPMATTEWLEILVGRHIPRCLTMASSGKLTPLDLPDYSKSSQIHFAIGILGKRKRFQIKIIHNLIVKYAPRNKDL